MLNQLRATKRYVVNIVNSPAKIMENLSLQKNHPLYSLAPERFKRDRILNAFSNFFRVSNRQFKVINNLKITSPKTFRDLDLACPLGLFEPNEFIFLLKYSREDDKFLDIGANIGAFSLILSSINKCKSLCIEALPSTYKFLVENINSNSLGSMIEAKNLGASDKEETLKFTSSLNVSNKVAPKTTKGDIYFTEVECKPLNKIAENYKCNILKVDVEGYETPVINGADTVLSSEDLQVIIIELNGHGEKYFNFNEDEVAEKISSYGFTRVEYDISTNSVKTVEGLRSLDGNSLYVKDITHVNERLKDSQFDIADFV